MKTRTTSYTLCFRNACSFLFLLLFLIPCIRLHAQPAGKNHPALKSRQHRRDELFAGPRADSSGSMKNYLNAIESIRADQQRNKSAGYDQAAQWYPLGPSKTIHPVLAQLGLVGSLWIDTSDFKTIYAGSNTGGIFRTTDGGENWTSLSDNYITTGVLAIQVDPGDKEKIYIGTGHISYSRAYGKGVLKSADGGKTWEETGLNSSTLTSNFTVRDLKFLPQNPHAMLALLNTQFRMNGYIYRSSDDAAHWEPVYTEYGAELFSIKPDPIDPQVLYVTGNRFLKSQDEGLTWTDHTADFPLDTNFVISRVEIAQTAENPDLMLAVVESYDTTGAEPTRVELFRSVDNGGSFQHVNMKYNPFAGYWKMELEISPAHPDEFYLGGIWLFKYRIEQDSAKYIPCSDHKYHKDVRELQLFKGKDKDLLYMGNDGGVSRSETGAESWQDITRNGLNITQFYNITIGENSDWLYAGPQDANLCFYNFSTGDWTKNAKVSDAYEGAIDYENPLNVYLISVPPKASQPNIFIMKSTDGGNFFDYYGIPDSTEIGRNDKPLAMDPVDPNTLYVGVRNVWKSTDGAVNWQKISDFPETGYPKLNAVRIAPSNRNVIAAAFENPAWDNSPSEKLWITPDGGNHWINITPTGQLNLNYAGISDVTFHPETPLKFWLSLDQEWENHHVYMTGDGGATWQNYSQGLPNVPVNTIAFVRGAGFDVLLAATDAGIYYRDAYMDQWVQYGSGLPLTIYSDIKISYTRKKIVASSFGRGLWETDLCMTVRDEDLVINDTLEWNGNRKMLRNVVLGAGARLTVRDQVEMGSGRSIRVMPGAELVLDGGCLTNDCVDMWQGVRLFGNSNYSGSPSDQGKISLMHGGTIQNADTAIVTCALDSNGNRIAGAGGGIIYARNAAFINNRTGIVINPSLTPNPSEFTLCRFITSKVLPDGTYGGDLVSLFSSSGIRFTSCQFENNLPFSALPFHERGCGIRSFNSSFTLGRLASADSIPFGLNADASFKQLACGIKATTSSPAASVMLENVRFDRNLQGVYLGGLSLCTIRNSQFNLNSSNVNDSLKPAISAIYLDQCNGYTVTGNTITGPLGAFVPKSKSAGIIVNQCGPQNHILSRNTIKNTNYALIAQKSNKNADGSDGLRVLYNWFSGNEYDICITSDSADSCAGIALHQGSSGSPDTWPAGNHFSHSKYHRDGDLHNEGEPLYYHYSDPGDTLNRIPVFANRIYRVEYTQPIPADSAFIPDYLNDNTGDLSGRFAQFDSLYAGLYNFYRQHLDGGNTGSLELEIRQCAAGQAPGLARKLSTLSPYLSQTILKALVKQQKTIPNPLIYNILSQNFHFLRNEAMIEAIRKMYPPLKNYMLSALAQSYNRYSGLELLESELGCLRSARDRYFLLLLGQLAKPLQITGNTDPLSAFLADDDRSRSQYLAAFYTLAYHNSAKAGEILNQIPLNFPAEPEAVYGHQSELFDLNQQLFQNGILPAGLSPANIESIENLSGFSETAVYADNILDFYGIREYNEPYIFPGDPSALQLFSVPDPEIWGKGFRVYPVPASDYVIIDFYAENGIKNGVLQISNMRGQTVAEISIGESYGQQLIRTSQLVAGNYLFVLRDGAVRIGEQKVVVVH